MSDPSALARSPSPRFGFEAFREDLEHHGVLYMRRWVVRVLGVLELRLHYTGSPDGGTPNRVRHLHDHPWRWMYTLGLWGWYTHDRCDAPDLGTIESFEPATKSPPGTYRQTQKPGRVLRFTARTSHAITAVSPKGCWTFVVAGPRRRVAPGPTDAGTWGFWVPRSRRQGPYTARWWHWAGYRDYFATEREDGAAYKARHHYYVGDGS